MSQRGGTVPVFVIGLVLGVIASGIWRLREWEKAPAKAPENGEIAAVTKKISPKVFIISMFNAEAATWYRHGDEFVDLKAKIIQLRTLVPQDFSKVQCTADGDVCQMITGMGLINATLSIAALLAAPEFDLSKTYFLIAGIGGINPKVGSLGSVVLARYVVQVDLQYELDAREMPRDWKTGYFPLGSDSPDKPPTQWYGTEVFELNVNLRDSIMDFLQSQPSLVQGSPEVTEYCTRYATGHGADHLPATMPPSLISADIASSNVFFHGFLLSEAISNSCKIFTNGAANYGITAQEDSGTLAALFLGFLEQKIDFSRILLMRAASNFDQPPVGETPEIPLHAGHGGFPLAVENIYRVGREIVMGIVASWDDKFEQGIPAENYIGAHSSSITE